MDELLVGLGLLLLALGLAGLEAHHLYGLLGILLSPLAGIYYLVASLRRRTLLFAGLRDRLGGFKLRAPRGTLWLHGASVGEVQLAEKLLAAMEAGGADSGKLPAVVSAVTAAGLERAGRIGPRVRTVLHPLDLPFVARRAVGRINPRLLVLIEGDYWLLTLLAARLRGARIVVVNARVSPRAFRRMGWVGFYYRACFRLVDEFLPRSAGDAQRLLALGVKPAQMGETADLKFDLPPPPPSPLGPAAEYAPLLVAASVYRQEFDAILDAFVQARTKTPGLRLLLAPRRAEDFDLAWTRLDELAKAHGWRAARRSALPAGGKWPAADLHLLDTYGELSRYFAGARLAFIGGSLFPHGGQNPLEAAAAGVPVLYGPSMENFARAIEQLGAAGAAIAVEKQTLAATLCGLLENPAALREAGARAAALVAANRGTTGRVAARLNEHWAASLAAAPDAPSPAPRPLPPALALLLTPAGLLWRFLLVLFSTLNRHGARLEAPVISVGNLSAGGTGKTPMTIWLARELERRGKKVAILSRGYGRRGSAPLLVSDGSSQLADSSRAGDEPALLAQALPRAVVAVAARRRAAAQLAARREPDVYLLDDGFQHRALGRDLNLCLLDPAAPLSTGQTLPWGSLREPLFALDRADLQLMPQRRCAGFTALAGGKPVAAMELPAPLFAYCAIGRPDSFFALIEQQGLTVVDRQAARDHARPGLNSYRARLEQAQAAGARAFVTTAKDAVKLRELNGAQPWPLPGFVLEMEIVLSPLDARRMQRALDVLFPR